MCDVPSIAVFCSESIECFPGTASKFFLKLLVTIPVALVLLLLLLLLLLLSWRLHRYGKNTALCAPWSVVFEVTVACDLLYDFLVFVHLAVFGDHRGTEVTAVETVLN